jgi:hypothetical protein
MYKECIIEGYEDLYLVYDNGLIWSIRKKHYLKPGSDGNYLTVILTSKNSIKLVIKVHQLVALHYLGLCPSNMEVNHKDLNKINNHYTNLEYVSHRDNIIHARSLKHWQSNRLLGYKHTLKTKQLMSIAKQIPVIHNSIIYPSIQQLAYIMHVNRRTIERRLIDHRLFKGYVISKLL